MRFLKGSGKQDKQKTVNEHRGGVRGFTLENDSFMNGELGDDMSEQEVAMVASRRIDAALAEKARPCKRHETAQPRSLLLVAHVMNMRRGLLHQQTRQLKQENPYAVGLAHRIVWVDNLQTHKAIKLPSNRNSRPSEI